jgi:predicted nucleotidyltransferase
MYGMSGIDDLGLSVDMEALASICSRYGVAELLIFGSTARGEADGDSDIDLLYRLAPGATLGWEIEELSDELTELFGRQVDLVSAKWLHPRLRDDVTAEARHLYAA